MEELLKDIQSRLEKIEDLLAKKKKQKPSTDIVSQITISCFNDPVANEFVTRAQVKPLQVDLWLRTYGDKDWIEKEILKMIAWIDCNKQKAPKANFTRFINSWLSRGWEFHRKNLSSNKPKKETNWDWIFADDTNGIHDTDREAETELRGKLLPTGKDSIDI